MKTLRIDKHTALTQRARSLYRQSIVHAAAWDDFAAEVQAGYRRGELSDNEHDDLINLAHARGRS